MALDKITFKQDNGLWTFHCPSPTGCGNSQGDTGSL